MSDRLFNVEGTIHDIGGNWCLFRGEINGIPFCAEGNGPLGAFEHFCEFARGEIEKTQSGSGEQRWDEAKQIWSKEKKL